MCCAPVASTPVQTCRQPRAPSEVPSPVPRERPSLVSAGGRLENSSRWRIDSESTPPGGAANPESGRRNESSLEIMDAQSYYGRSTGQASSFPPSHALGSKVQGSLSDSLFLTCLQQP
ncbi:uncharacterized protein BO97DRAFT_43969 [Aspergillus homomorphus CBS 101889]|uniref:Uncharacterized protein n=1 Tax=Aspergillus homomorphus (strain CBS 101889) TaxID=1450537 RepID=A0A395I3Y2_ASPHC|nr:hypothetical protein BO97DRAFT_43969 [Aspergillus homomorphus CBS 101889]RAL13114.1 hypothetical protein BO97DRAFT_43969 [Aspergillus homomorphus CBS 101889]